MNLRPVLCKFDLEEGVFRVHPDHLRIARRYYVHDEEYPMEVHEQRSSAAHKAYFASIKTAWKNLPESYRDEYPTPEHLRKRALVACGYCNTKTLNCTNGEMAERVMAFVKQFDEFAVVEIKESTVLVHTPMSQSMYGPQRMDRETFHRSSEDVLECLAKILRIKRSDLVKNAEKAA